MWIFENLKWKLEQTHCRLEWYSKMKSVISCTKLISEQTAFFPLSNFILIKGMAEHVLTSVEHSYRDESILFTLQHIEASTVCHSLNTADIWAAINAFTDRWSTPASPHCMTQRGSVSHLERRKRKTLIIPQNPSSSSSPANCSPDFTGGDDGHPPPPNCITFYECVGIWSIWTPLDSLMWRAAESQKRRTGGWEKRGGSSWRKDSLYNQAPHKKVSLVYYLFFLAFQQSNSSVECDQKKGNSPRHKYSFSRFGK